MVKGKKKPRLGLDLDTGLLKKFDFIQKDMGLKNRTEVIRRLINDKYEEVYEKLKKKGFKL